MFIWGRGGSTHRGIHCQEPTKGFTDKVVVSYLNIIVVRGKALRPLGSDVNIRAHQRPKVALQLLLNLPQLILYKKKIMLLLLKSSAKPGCHQHITGEEW